VEPRGFPERPPKPVKKNLWGEKVPKPPDGPKIPEPSKVLNSLPMER